MFQLYLLLKATNEGQKAMCIRSLQTMMKTKLFSPLEIGSMTVKNRIDVQPICMWHAAKDLHESI